MIASTCTASAVPTPSFRLIEAPAGTSPCLRPRLNRKGDPAVTVLDPEVSVSIQLAIAPGAAAEPAAAPGRRRVCAFADVANATAPAAPVVFNSRRREILIPTNRSSGKFPSKFALVSARPLSNDEGCSQKPDYLRAMMSPHQFGSPGRWGC